MNWNYSAVWGKSLRIVQVQKRRRKHLTQRCAIAPPGGILRAIAAASRQTM
ncbi:hypothetical protein [Thermoleptolyngbya sp. C42_A2020_037]|uniref:hypothetical protein n=1 Tax=Thermoleptolyngbya sp. C42_A2020_037 TaxID=2747799 RepID=UPI001A09B14F|nr:hypothetical protein [Thermoleptolyngbya sp. C42_A2020_037]MBF2086575.1 hypothetical protein [Thermoleptolyngbya sp. C42_A2020_037]